VTPNDRNKKDEVIGTVVMKGGVIGLNALPRTVSATNATLEGMLDHVDYITKKFGMQALGLGLDYVEGFKKAGHIMPQSVRNRTLRPDIFGSVEDFLNVEYAADLEKIEKLPNLTRGLLARGYSEENVRRILGENWVTALEKFVG
jgi:membrane dipeptidase